MRKPVLILAVAAVLVGLLALLIQRPQHVTPATPQTANRTAESTVAALRAPQQVAAVSNAQTNREVISSIAPAAPLSLESIAAFADWTQVYLKTPEGDRAAMVAQGVAFAEARRPALKQLIQRDPRRALEQAVPMVVRQQLPPEIVSKLEARVNGRAALRVYQGVGMDNQSPAPTHRVAEFASGETYVANVYGRRAETVTWLSGASMNGIAVDEQFAAHEDPIRPLEIGEKPDPLALAVAICPVSGKSTVPEEEQVEVITEETPAIEAFGEVVYLCNGDHAIVYKEQLIYAEGSSGGAMPFTGALPAAPTPSIGNVKVLVIPMTFADQNDTPSTETALFQLMRDVGEHYAKASYGKLTLVPTVTPPIKLPHNEVWYVQKDTQNGGTIDGLGLEHSHARAEARKLGYDDADYDTVVVRLRGGARSSGVGGWGGGSSVWIYSDGLDLTAHEVGHCFGLAHANFWQTSGSSAIGIGTSEEYGGHWDVMGGVGLPRGHYNAQGKNQIRWLPDTFVEEITSSGVYSIYAQDQPVLDPSRRFALKVRKDSLRTYWGELRGLWTGDSTRTWADHGLILGWRYPGGGGGNWQLIDTSPGSPFNKDDSPVSLGRTFSDTEAGIHITTLSTSPATNDIPKSINVVVNIGQFESNQAPELALTASAVVVPVNVPVSFTATATDPDGDPIAFSWQHFGDSAYRVVSPNVPVLTRSFSAAGTYVVACTASDMKGGTTTRNILVTVGNGGSRYTIAGRITLNGHGVAGVLVRANNANGVITDSDGQFTIPNLTPGTYSLTPSLYGYTFSELFNNSITVAPNFSGANFEASSDARVSIVATTPSCSEASVGVPARFTISRTGDASQALTVSVISPIGTAVSATDYTISPALASGSQGFNTVTIPAGSDSLLVSVTPINDALAEGPETVVLQIGAGSGYLVEGLARATVVIDDNDTSLPKVSLAATDAKTVEASGTPATVTFTRSGSTAASLAVAYSVSGTASTNDFGTLAGVLVIPAGAASAILNISSVDDAISESLESVTVRISTTPQFLADPVANEATVSIVDDDVQVVTVVASDASAAEVDLSLTGSVADTATFLVTRAGDLTQPLTVFYAVSGTNSGSAAGALHGVDYESLPGVLTIPAGQSSAAVTIIPRWDGIGEGPESVVFHLGAGPTNYRLGLPSAASATITDAGDPPYVEVLAVDNATEGGASGSFRFSLKGSVSGTINVNYTVSGTATSGSDFTALSGTVAITGNGVNVVNVSVPVINDSVPEDLETVTVTITPGAGYQSFGPSSTATIWMYDNEQPTLFVDAHSGSYPPSFAENSSGSSFYITRTGSTNTALTVNYTMSGSAGNGVDYQALSGTVVMAAGRRGIDLNVVPIDDAIGDGVETVTLTLAPGAYGRGPAATFYITDNETPAITVSFLQASAAVPEDAGTTEIPVVLSSAPASPVAVEYLVDSAARSSVSVNGTGSSPLPYWVRLDRKGDILTGFISADGTNWTGVSTQAVAMPSSTFMAGLYVCSYNAASSSTAVFDNVVVTNLQPGATIGARTGANIGTTALAGSATVNADVYTISGAGDNVEGTTDQGYFTWWPINNSTSCTVIARVVSQGNTHALATAGVMIREAVGNNVRRAYMAATPSSGFEYHYRSTSGGQDAKVTSVPARPLWVRLQRTGDLIRAFQSDDGAAWTQISSNLPIAFGPDVMAGLVISSQDEGLLATTLIDSVALNGQPFDGYLGRTVGFSAIQGTHAEDSGTFTLAGSGEGINGTQDDCYFLSAGVSGDFELIARVMTLDSGAASPQAGVMVRESTRRTSRMAFVGGRPGAAPQLVWRTTTVTVGQGSGIDFTLTPGVLTFPVGVRTQFVAVAITDDTIPEPHEPVSIVLRNPTFARLGTVSQFTLAIADNDAAPPVPFAGFAAATNAAVEAAGVVQVPVTLSVPATSSASVDYTISAGTASAATDFVAASGTLVFNSGQTVAFVPVTLVDDANIEPGETILLSLGNAVGLGWNTLTNQTLTIIDDDSPVITISSTDTNSTELGDTASITVARAGSTAADLIVNLSRAGTASIGTDYTGIDATATIPAGSASTTLLLQPVQDGTLEGTETVIVSVSAGNGYTVGRPSSVTNFISDDDRNIVMIEATTPVASEAGAAGILTLTRSGNVDASLSITLTITGTGGLGTDYSTAPSPATSITFAAGETTRTITITAIDDGITEGEEVVLAQLSGSGYDIGGVGYASVAISDNDIPPTAFISSPSAQGVVVAVTNGLFFDATAEDDGYPQALRYQWSQVSGPGTITFESPTNATSAATFSAPGVYLVRLAVTDGQFNVTDQITVNIGATNALVPADWISSDIGPATVRGYSGQFDDGWVISGTGIGYASNSDRAHAVTRQVSGDGSIIARVVSVNGPAAAEAGIDVRDSLHRYSRRGTLVYQASTRTLRLRIRQVSNTTGFSVAVANVDLPVMLRIDRSTNNTIAAYYATNSAGPANWIQVSTNVNVTMDGDADYSFTAHSGSDTAAATVVFDNVALTPAPAGPATLAEDFGDGTQAGSYSYNAGTDVHTLNGTGSFESSGMFWGQHVTGDFILTALQLDATSSGNNSRSGIMIRDSMDDSSMVFFGRNPVGSFSCYVWRTNPKGGTSGLNGVTARTRWFRLVRRGSQVTAYHAPNNSGVPGAWVQLGLPQTVFMQPGVIAGLYCDNQGGVGFNTATFTKVSMVPLNNAPIVNAGPNPTNAGPAFALSGSVRDDGLPDPFVAEWTVAAGGSVTFANSNAAVTAATVANEGSYVLRLSADDGIARSFDDLALNYGSGNPFQSWQAANFANGASNPNAAPDADPDGDGLNNAGEYAFNTNPNSANAHPVIASITTNGSAYLRVTIPKNPAATDATLSVEAAGEVMGPWSSAGIVIETNTPTLLQARDNVPVSANSRRYMRVRVTLP